MPYKKTKHEKIIFFIIMILAALQVTIAGAEEDARDTDIITLKNIETSNQQVKELRNDIRKAIITIKSRKAPEELPLLKFYKYTVKRGETFWKILSKTSQNIDTLFTVNSISCPGKIQPGAVIYIPNIRGIVIKNDYSSLKEVSDKYKIKEDYIKKINSISSTPKSYLFIPNAQVSRLERSLFLGTAFASPICKGRRSSGFGNRIDPFNNTIKFHAGIDIACPPGTRVHAARSGKVVFAGYNGNYGLLVIVKHSHDYYSYYGHLKTIGKKPGDNVKTGEFIAISGNTGRSTGPHLHFEIRKNSKPVNPGVFVRIK